MKLVVKNFKILKVNLTFFILIFFQYCLSNDPNKPCHILTFKEVTMMLDCGLSMQAVLNFLPLSFVQSNKFLNMPVYMPNDVADPELEGVQTAFLIFELFTVYL